MADSVVKPDAVLDGQEFSAITRMLEALHNNKDVGLDQELLDAANSAHLALKAQEAVVVEDMAKLHEAAKAYQKAVADEILGQFPSVRGDELKKIVKKIEGLAQLEETVDEDGKKVHPAALPAGDRPVGKPEEDLSVQKVQIVDGPEKKEEASPEVDHKALEAQKVEAGPADKAPESTDSAALEAQKQEDVSVFKD